MTDPVVKSNLSVVLCLAGMWYTQQGCVVVCNQATYTQCIRGSQTRPAVSVGLLLHTTAPTHPLHKQHLVSTAILPALYIMGPGGQGHGGLSQLCVGGLGGTNSGSGRMCVYCPHHHYLGYLPLLHVTPVLGPLLLAQVMMTRSQSVHHSSWKCFGYIGLLQLKS